MKKAIYLFLFTVFLFIGLASEEAIAQSYTLNAGNTYVKNMGFNDLQYDGLEWTNNSSQTLILNWRKISEDTVGGSYFDMCASGNCYIGVPDSGAYIYYPTLPGQVGFLKFHFWTGAFSGVSKVRMYIYETAQPLSGDTLTYILNVNQANGINPLTAETGFSVFPNPSDRELQLVFKAFNMEDKYEIKISNSIGQLVYSNKLDAMNFKIDVSAFSTGVYFARIVNDKNEIIQTKKISINHN